MKTSRLSRFFKWGFLLLALISGLLGIFMIYIPQNVIRCCLFAFCVAVMTLALLWDRSQKHESACFANGICETADALMEDRELENFQPYNDSMLSKVQGKLLQYYDKMKDSQQQSIEDKQIIQELVSDISHQVKTPIANIQMFMDIMQHRCLSKEKQAEFLNMTANQVSKLDFLMESLIKMSRLETGTFTIHMEKNNLYHTVAQAVNSVWAKAEQKNIDLDVDCDKQVPVKHDPKWTAEALVNLLDNAIKYTPQGGSVHISVRPWQFYTRIDIADTGTGIAEQHYNDVFQRFYRVPETAAQEGVGLGLYLARGIITHQKGYISVKSEPGKGTVFSVYLLS